MGIAAGMHCPRAGTCADLSSRDAAPRAAVKPRPYTLPKPEEMDNRILIIKIHSTCKVPILVVKVLTNSLWFL